VYIDANPERKLRPQHDMDYKKFLPKILLTIAVTGALAYVACSPLVAWPLYNLYLFPPKQSSHFSEDHLAKVQLENKVNIKRIEFAGPDKAMLRGRFFELPGTKRVYLYSHGRGIRPSHRLNIIEALIKSGGSVLDYDYVGVGDSDGTASIEGSRDSAVAAYDYLTQVEHRSDEDIIGYGQSFGCGPCAQIAKYRKPAAIILQSGYPSLIDAGRQWLAWLRVYPDAVFPKETLDSVAIFSKPHPPLLLIHGDKDNTLTLNNQKTLFDAAVEPKQLVIIPGAGHNIVTYNMPEAQAAISNFLKTIPASGIATIGIGPAGRQSTGAQTVSP
jgi:alpha-beta hydrolase superfamily lysophospholipase